MKETPTRYEEKFWVGQRCDLWIGPCGMPPERLLDGAVALSWGFGCSLI
jgi:hypothetical protein